MLDLLTDPRILGMLGSLFKFLAVVVCLGYVLARLIDRDITPMRALRAQEEARVRAIEATLRAVRLGLIRIPRVYSRTVR
jgi:hypothetical protein